MGGGGVLGYCDARGLYGAMEVEEMVSQDSETAQRLDAIRKELIPIMQRHGVTHFFYVIEDLEKEHFDILTCSDIRSVLTKIVRIAAQALEKIQVASVRAYNNDGSSEPIQG